MNSDGLFELASSEGTTQGCPLAMAMYALSLVPLVRHLQPLCKQVWYADDATAGRTTQEGSDLWLLPQTLEVYFSGQT